MILAQASSAPELGWPAAMVAIVTALVPLGFAILQYLRLKEERRRRQEAEGERDAAIIGIERGGDSTTKAMARDEAKDRGVKTFNGTVRKVTKRLAPLLLGFFLLAPMGCQFVDHDQMVETAEIRQEELRRTLGLADALLTPEFTREVFQAELKAWEQLEERLGGEEAPK